MQRFEIAMATAAQVDEVIRLFGALHGYNAELDPRFALADDWQQLVGSYLEQITDADDSAWFLAWHGGRAVGFVLVEVHTESPLYRHRRWAEIVGLYVEPDYRGSNVASALMDQAYGWAREHGLSTMQLYVTNANDAAQRFYTKQGFTTTQVIMRRTIGDTDTGGSMSSRHRLRFSEGGARPFDMHDRDRG